jgi:hypothetical protein
MMKRLSEAGAAAMRAAAIRAAVTVNRSDLTRATIEFPGLDIGSRLIAEMKRVIARLALMGKRLAASAAACPPTGSDEGALVLHVAHRSAACVFCAQ